MLSPRTKRCDVFPGVVSTASSTDRTARGGRAPSAKLAVSLAVDPTPADAKQRFLLNDDIVLRNSRPS